LERALGKKGIREVTTSTINNGEKIINTSIYHLSRPIGKNYINIAVAHSQIIQNGISKVPFNKLKIIERRPAELSCYL